MYLKIKLEGYSNYFHVNIIVDQICVTEDFVLGIGI